MTEGEFTGVLWWEDIRIREAEGVHLWKEYGVCTVCLRSFRKLHQQILRCVSRPEQCCRSALGCRYASRIGSRLVQDTNKKCCKGTSMCFEQDLCTIPSECVKPVKLWLAFRHNLNTANLIVSMLSTRNGLPTAVCSFTHSFIFFFL